jgi:hypothetical protein
MMSREENWELDGLLGELGLHGPQQAPPDSAKAFPDGERWRIEIPSVEGPEALQAVIDAAAERDVPVRRISQGSGIMLQSDAEIAAMVELGRAHDIEICLFVGPRAGWDTGVQAASPGGAAMAATLRGDEQLRHAVADVRRGCELGLRSILVADIGLLWILARMRSAGDLPEDLRFKVSVSLPAGNPATARLLEELGADTVNVPVDLSVSQLAALRRAIDIPIDLYIEGPDDLGGPVRHHEVPEIVRVAAPVHLKFAVRNAAPLYPAGEHLRAHALATARERVRRASLALGLLRRAEAAATSSV